MTQSLKLSKLAGSTYRITIKGKFIGFMTELESNKVVLNLDKIVTRVGLARDLTMTLDEAYELFNLVEKNNLV